MRLGALLALGLLVMPVIWTGTAADGEQFKVNHEHSGGLVAIKGAGRKAKKTRLPKAEVDMKTAFARETLLGKPPPADLLAAIQNGTCSADTFGHSRAVRAAAPLSVTLIALRHLRPRATAGRRPRATRSFLARSITSSDEVIDRAINERVARGLRPDWTH